MMVDRNFASRREFLAAAGASAAVGSLAGTGDASAQGTAPSRIVDFHNHYMGAAWAQSLTTLASVPPAGRAAWERINGRLASEASLIESIEAAGIAGRVINAPTAFVEDADGNMPKNAHRRANDGIAEVVSKFPEKLHGLASVDAFSGDAGAQEVTRAVKELKLRGVFLESAKRDRLLGDKETRPTLAAAAALGVPVFVHPQTDLDLHRRFSRTGPIGLRLARATINSAALVSLLESGTFDDILNLRVVVTTLAFGGVLLAGGFGDGQNIRGDATALARRHVYIDTMGINPAVIRAAVDLLGADHVLVGTDWPIVEEKSVPERLQRAFDHAGLTAAERQAIASDNALRLLGVA
jgi:aminocarboxymuconate-semialdehyde decarboxylase